MLLGETIKFLKSTNNDVYLKIKPNKKLTTLPVTYQYIMNKVLLIWTKLPTYLEILNLLFSNLYYWEELLKFSNPQIRAFI